MNFTFASASAQGQRGQDICHSPHCPGEACRIRLGNF